MSYDWPVGMPGETRHFIDLPNGIPPFELVIGAHSYGPLRLLYSVEDTSACLRVGRYGSFGEGVTIYLGVWGRHFIDTVTNYPLTARFGLPLDLVNSAVNNKDLTVEIGSDVWIGRNATIMAGVKIGHGAVIGANSIVTRDVEPYAIVAGNPARVVRMRFKEDVVKRLLATRWWDWPDADVVKHVKVLQTNDMETAIAKLEEVAAEIAAR